MKNQEKKVLILGGTRSGKSQFGLRWCQKMPGKKAFVATCQAPDDEMQNRIAAHRQARDSSWDTIEEFYHLGDRINQVKNHYQVILIDCLTLWLSNWVLKEAQEIEIRNEIESFKKALAYTGTPVVMVSNEVGMGIVPPTSLGRTFRDLQGCLNQEIASLATEMYLLVAGTPLQIK